MRLFCGSVFMSLAAFTCGGVVFVYASKCFLSAFVYMSLSSSFPSRKSIITCVRYLCGCLSLKTKLRSSCCTSFAKSVQSLRTSSSPVTSISWFGSSPAYRFLLPTPERVCGMRKRTKSFSNSISSLLSRQYRFFVYSLKNAFVSCSISSPIFCAFCESSMFGFMNAESVSW